MSEDTFKKYDQEYKNWKKTGKYSDGFSSWMNQDELDLYKNIKSGNGRSARSNGSYYYMDNDTYDKYGKEYANWKSTNKYSDDFASWKNDDDLNAYKAIRGSRSKQDNAFDDFRNSLNDEILESVRQKYRDKYFGDKNYYDYTGGEIYAQNAGEMPEYLKGKYNQNDPYDRWLYENGLPYSSVFNDLYSEAVNDYNANIQKQKEEYETEKKYLTAENDFRNAVYQQINGMEPDDVTEDTWREVIANVYESDPEKYQEIIGNFNYKAGTEDEIVPGSNEYFASAQKNGKQNPHAFTVTDLMTEYNGMIEKSQAEYIASLPPEQQAEVTSALEDQKIQEQQTTLTQQLRQIDAEMARLGASGWNPNTSRMKELTQQRADIVAQLDAVNAEKNEKDRAEDTQKLLNVENVEATDDIEAELVDLNIKLAGYRLPDGTYRETEENKELIARHKELEDKLTRIDTAGRSLQNVNTFLAENGGTDQIADTSKWSSKATHNYKALTGQAGRAGKLLKLATAEEIAGANMAASQGEEAFNAYFKDLETVLKFRSTQERSEKFEAMAQKDPVGASLLSVPMNMAGAVEGLGNVLSSVGTGYGNAVDMVYAGYMTSASQTVRNTVSEDIILNNSDQSMLPGVSTGQIYSFLYQSGMSMLDTAARMPLGSTGLAVAGLSACDSTILEQLENGATTREAVTLGVVAGFAEYITEEVSLESLLTAKNAGNLKQFLREVCKQMITEGSEEMASEVINIIAEAITLENNNFTVPGILARVGEAGLGGLVSGLGFGAAGQAARFARSGRFADRVNVKLGKQLTRDLLGKKGGTNFFGKTGEMGKFRVEYTNAVMKSGLSDEAQTDLINLMDQMADDYGFIGTKEGQRLARSLKTLVENESGNHQVLVKQFQEQQMQNQKRLSAMLDNLTNLSEQAASMTNDPEGHSALYQQFMQATQEYQEAQQQIQDKEDISEIKLQEAERKAEQKVLDAVESTANQYQELSAQIAETEAGQQLADLEQQLLNEEVSASDTEYIKNVSDDTIEDAKVSAMENGDDRTFNLLDEMLEAKHSGDDARIAQFAEKNPDIIEMMWNNELGEAVENGAENVTEEESAISNAVNANKAPTRSAFTGPFASAYENAIYNIDRVKGAIENGRLQQNNGRNAESASAETAEQNGAVRNNGERQNENASEQTNTGRNSEIVKNTQEVKPRRVVAHWTENESKGAENIERLYRENGINLRVNQVENVPEAYGRAMGAAMNFLGNKDGVVLYTQTKDSDDYVMHGQCYNGTPMVRYTGTDSDIAYTYHENGHAHQQYLQMVKDAMGDAYNTVLNKYIETAPESQKGYSRDEMAEEMLCDVFGLFGMHQVFGAEANGNEYINARQLQHVFDTLDNAWADTAYAEDNESVRQIGTDEKYSLSNRSIEAVENRMMEDKYEDVLAPPEDGQPRFSMRTITHSAGLDMERKNGAFTVAKNGKNVNSITTKDLNGTQIGAIINQAVDRGFVSARDANKEKTFIKDLVNMMIRNKDADMVWAFAGSQVFSAITNNADAQYSKTVDFTTICRKTQAIINEMSERMMELERGLTDEEILQIQDELAKRGEAVPCPVCYVFSRWVGIGGVLERIKNYQNKYADINVAKAALENHTDPDAETWLKKVRLEKGYKPVPSDVLFNLNAGGEFASEYPLTWKYRTTRGPALGKAMTPYAEMNVGDVVQGLRKNPKKILKGESSPFESIDGEKFGPAALKELLRSESAMRQQNLLGGLRYQSTSDFRTDYALDYLLSFFDVQAVGGKIQTYSKQPDGARLLASVGADVNLSVMPKGKGWKLDADGNEILDSSSITGMDFKTAVALKNQFDNVQLIMVGINDDHIRISLANSDIGFVIPYHASGGKVDFITTMARNLGETVRMQDYQDYADCQTDAINPFATAEQKSAYDLRMRILTGKAKTLSAADQQILDKNPILQNLYNRFYVEGVDPDCYGVKLKKSQANMVMPFEYWDTNSTLETANENGKTFVRYCESLGLIPRFSGKKVANGKIYNLDHGNFVDLDGYWKTLIDRPMYNRDGSYHVQQRVNVSGVTSDMLSEDPNLQFTSEAEDEARLSSRDINQVTPQMDADYMDAVDRGDTETAQRMVDERARTNGYTQVVFHGTEEDFDEFKANEFATERNGLSNIKGYFDTSSEYAGAYGDVNKYYLKTDNFLHFDNDELGNGTLEDYRKFFEQHGVTDVIFDSAIPDDSLRGGQFEGVDGKSYYTWEILEPAGYSWNGDGNVTERIRAAGYEGISWNEGYENGDVAYMPFNASAIKSADPITYREDGSPIPLSERFDSENPKYRYSNRTIPSMSQRSEDVAKQAEKLFADGTSLTDYYMSGNYDNAVAAQLRTLKLKNGEDVGGKLSEQEVSKIIKDASNWKKGNMYAFKAPVRIFQEVGKWRDTRSKNAADYSRAVALNMEADEYYSDKYYSYMQQQLADENVFKQGVLDKINAIDPSEQDAILAQLIGERIITPEMARTAVMDSKHILIPIGNGAMVLDRKGRVRYMADQQSLLLFSDDVLKKAAERVRKINEIRNDDKPNKDARIKDVQKSANGPEETMGAYRLEVNGDHYAIVNENGNTVFEMDGENAYSDKAVDLAETLSAIYGSMYDSVQSTLVENGYAPIGHIENYFPHFTQAREGVAGMIDYLKSEDLPVGIAGLTPDFSPGKPWARNLLTRLGDKTDYNAVRGFEGYLNGVSDVIYMTPVIQRFRQLESALRTGMASKTSEEGPVNEANTNFIRWLHDYTNQLANKKPMVDRGVEETFGRKVYTLPTKLSGWIGTAYIGANVRTALTNMASFAQGAGQLAPKWIGRGLFNTATSDQSEFGDDFRNVCTFLINRQSQAEEVALNMGDKFRQRGEKILFGLMEAVDNFSTETIARAKYYQLTQEEGLSSEDALREVSKWCVKLFAERSKGSRATIFNSKVMSPLTQFQIEPFNQLWHWSDIHNENIRSEYRRILRENGGTLDGVDWSNVENQVNKVSVSMKDLKKILGRLIALSVYGMIMRVLTGADATWNPAGIVSDMVNGARKNGAEGAGKAVRKNIMDNIPFSSLVEMIGSAVGLGDDEFGSTTSIPIPALSAVNTAISAIKGGTPESYLEGATYFIPGGGQLRKTAKGVGALVREGSYNKNGKLRYPIDQTPGNAIRAAVFGTSAVAPNGYEYGNVLSEKKTGAYQTAVDQGVDKHDAYDFLLNQYQADSKAYELASLATSDLGDADMRIMAEILGIDVGKGDIKKQAVKEVREQIKSVEKKHEKGTIQDATYEKRIADYEAFLEDLLRG